LYDILEVSRRASPATLKAAYDRLSRHWSEHADSPQNDDAKLQLAAIKDAFLTLGNPDKRAAYDKRLDSQWAPADSPFWTLPKVALAAIVLLAAGALYYDHHAEKTRIAAEKEIAFAKAKEAEEQARAAAEEEKARQETLRLQAAAAEARQRRENEITLRRFTGEQSIQERNARIAEDRERRGKHSFELQRQREEQQAVIAAQRRADRERATLCQMERERYGRAISCGY
jgi:curved DNA-binding protein CbpA